MSPLSRISAGSFFSGYMLEYSSLGWPGTTVVGTNSILSIKPSSIAAMRTLRANGEEGEKVSFMGFPELCPRTRPHPEGRAVRRASRRMGNNEPFSSPFDPRRMNVFLAHPSRRAQCAPLKDEGRYITPRQSPGAVRPVLQCRA